METLRSLSVKQIASLESVITDVPSACFAKTVPLFGDSSIGGHVRHVIDFYSAFLKGVEVGHVDYSARERSPLLESDPHEALKKLAICRRRIEGLSDSALSEEIEVCSDSGVSLTSNIARELEYLASHTVHHSAIIRFFLTHAGADCDEQFGFAASTIRSQAMAS